MAVPDPQFDELYREVILDHYRRPRNRGELENRSARAEGLNPVCGDEVRIDLRMEADRLAEVAFGGQGCSISQSSASMLTERLMGTTVAEARSVAGDFRAMMVENARPADSLGDLAALEGVAKFPVRVKCALLPWTVFEQGLREAGAPA